MSTVLESLLGKLTSLDLRHSCPPSSLGNLDASAGDRCSPSWLALHIPTAPGRIQMNAKKVDTFKRRWLSVVGRQPHRATLEAAKQEFNVVSVCTEGPERLGKHTRRKCFLHDVLWAAYNQHPSLAAGLDKCCQKPGSPFGFPVSRRNLKQSSRDKHSYARTALVTLERVLMRLGWKTEPFRIN